MFGIYSGDVCFMDADCKPSYLKNYEMNPWDLIDQK